METSRFGVRASLKLSNWIPWVSGPLINRALIVAFVLLVGVCSLPPILNYFRGYSLKDYPLWYETGQKVVNGERVYPLNETFPFMYPPIAAILLAPLSLGGQLVMIVALVAINSAVWMASILLSVYLVTGKALRQHPLLYLLPTFCSIPFAFDTYHLGQPNLLLLAVMLGAFACLRNGRERSAGALVALAVGIKAFPLMSIVYFVYRRHWVALLSVFVSLLVLFTVVPFVARGYTQATEDTTVWARGMLLNYNADSIGQRTARAYSWKNQSLVGMANRLLRHKSADENQSFYVNVVDLDFRATNSIIVGVALGLCLFYIGVMPRYSARTPQSDAIEYAMLLLLILLFSPYTFGYFFVWLLYPFAVLVHLWFVKPQSTTDSRRLGMVFVGAVILLCLSILVRQRTAEVYGNFFLTSLLLLGALGWQLRKLKHSIPTAQAATTDPPPLSQCAA